MLVSNSSLLRKMRPTGLHKGFKSASRKAKFSHVIATEVGKWHNFNDNEAQELLGYIPPGVFLVLRWKSVLF